MPFPTRSLRALLLVFLTTLALWTVVTWPLATHVTEAIPVSARAPAGSPLVEMVPGDHLQLLYQIWLGHDTFFGETPWSTNLYEFNTGDDLSRRGYSTYYFPFHFFFSPGYWLAGHAAGYNLAGWLSVFVSVLASWLWLRRWVPGRPEVTLGACILGQLLPYRWHTLLHGSPTGLSLMWVPVMLLGVDIWLRDDKARGAALAGAAVFFSGWSDIHVLFFNALLAVAWVVPNFLVVHRRWWPGWKACLNTLTTSWPLWIWMALTGWQVAVLLKGMKGTNVQDGRSSGEVALFSHPWSHLTDPAGFGGTSEIYLGPLLIGLLSVGMLCWIWMAWRDAAKRPLALLFAVLAVGTLLISLMAVGPNHPLGDIWWARTLRILPPLAKLRQPAKVFLLLPPLVSLMAALSFSLLPRRQARWCIPLLVLLTGWTLVSRLEPHLTLLQDRNKAYEAVVQDAGREVARAVVVPLWPGDSHWSSLYVHHAMTAHLRVINGYKPSRNLAYMQEVFEPLNGINLGWLPDSHLDVLSSHNITHLILQENAFPEKVSPFAVGRTLSRLLAHPRLVLISQDGPTWAFRILPQPRTPIPSPPPWRFWATKGAHNAEFGESPLEVAEAEDLAKGAAAWLHPDHPPLRLNTAWTDLEDPLRLFLRVKGKGTMLVTVRCGDTEVSSPLEIDATDFQWMSLPLPTAPELCVLRTEARMQEGEALIDLVQAGPAAWNPTPQTPVELYAAELFHAGHTDLTSNRVVFLPARDPAAAILYGPNLPLMPGRYRLELAVHSQAPEGTLLGVLQLRGGGSDAPRTDVRSGTPASMEFLQDGTTMFNIEFVYAGEVPVEVGPLRLLPLEPYIHH